MELSRALRIDPGQVVTFTGAGGKTGALKRLAGELPPAVPLLLTTTTKLGEGQETIAAHHWVASEAPRADELGIRLNEHGTVLLTGEFNPHEGKWSGVPASWIDELVPALGVVGGVIAVEGDGARQRSLKAPASHEPVVPLSSHLVVPMADLRAIGRPLTEKVAHRPERAAEVMGLALGDLVTMDGLARLLTSAEGGLKGVPEKATVRVLLTGSAEAENPELGWQVARRSLGASRVASALVGDLRESDPVEGVVGRVAGVVLAAGGSSRMGGLKQAEEWQGQPLVAHALEAASEGGLAPVILIVGQGADRVREAAGRQGILVVHNEAWSQGQSTSVRAGLASAQRAGAEAVVFLLADMPLVDAELVGRIRRRYERTLAPIVAPKAQGRFGNPVLFDRGTFEALEGIEGDRGGRALYDDFPVEAVGADRAALVDIDSEEDWDRLD